MLLISDISEILETFDVLVTFIFQKIHDNKHITIKPFSSL